ncbi:MAG: DUF349 domain-containing protein [Bacteroidota bacterium]|nr:DUF349 domain-containing protein [Bacteroidota bacterium]
MINENKQFQEEEISQNAEQLNGLQNEVSEKTVPQQPTDEESNFEENHEDFSSWSKEDLHERLKEIITQDKIQGNISVIHSVKDTYRSRVKNENEEKLKEYLASGGLTEDFSGIRSEMDESFEELIKKFFKKRKELKIQKEKELILNLVIKKQIIEDLKQLAKTSENLSKAFEKFHELQAKWRETGKVPLADEEDLWQNYRFQNDLFFNSVNLNKELRDLDRTKNVELKTALCEKAEKLSEERVANKATKELKTLQDEWKDIGFIPKEESDLLWERFKAAADVVYEKQKAQNEKTKVKLEENLKAKQLLCKDMEALLEKTPSNHKEWKNVSDKAEELMQQWKKISFVPKSDNGQTWEKFKSLRNQFFKNKDVFYSQIKDVQSENLKIKISLCEKAESLKDSTDWETTANALKRLQHEWKNSGPVPVKQSDKIWKRFRTACDTFFDNKNKEREAENAQQNENLNKRKEIINSLANLEVSESKETNMEAIKSIQNEFNEIGDISSRDNEFTVKNFNKALDSAINKMAEKTGGNQSEFFNLRYENLVKTEEGKATVRKERSTISDKIKHLQADVMQMENNFSFFSKSKNAEAMLSDFQKKIDAGKAEIQKLSSELNRIPKV